MKKFLLPTLFLLAGATQSTAQLNGNGYYRVENFVTERYVYITDNKGHVDPNTSSVDALAIQLWKDFSKAAHDPATVLYFESKGGNEYDIKAQGTSVNQIINHNVSIRANSDGTYFAYGTQNGAAKYLGDANSSDAPEGTMSSEATGNRRKWYIKPITAEGDNYFGILPTVTAGSKYYSPMYASFPMSAQSSGIKFYVVRTVGYGMAVLDEVTGTLPGATPCIIECSTPAPATNRMTIGGQAAAVSGNKLGGVYFENYMNTHRNLTPYDPATMRLLGVLSDGTLGFVTGSIEYLPANQSYLKVPAGSPAEIRIVSQAEYDQAVGKMPTGVTLSQTSATVYTGGQLQLSATIAPADASDKSLTWKSSAASVATVDASGLVKAVAPGKATITATTINGLSATCEVTVKPVYPESITVTPAQYKLYEGESYQLTATVAPADAQYPEVTWASGNTAVLTVDAGGKITAVKAGTATVTASTADGKTATCAVTVNPIYPQSITFSSAQVYVRAGESVQLSPTLNPSDVKDASLTWTSSNTSIATVDAGGKVTGVASGEATVTVASPGGASASIKVTVQAPLPESISLNFEVLVMETGDSRYLSAKLLPEGSLSSVTWASSATGVVSVSSIGEVTAVAPGEATVTATTPNGLSASCSVTVLPKGVPATSVTISPASVSLVTGEQVELTATIAPENVSNPFLTWTSNNEKVAVIDQNGVVTAVGLGTSVIYARCGSVSGMCVVTVKETPHVVLVSSIHLNPASYRAEEGTEFTITATVLPVDATDKSLIWTSDNTEVATVDADGKVKILAEGNATVTATAADGSGVSATCAITGISGIDEIFADSATTLPVYNINGTLLIKAATAADLRSLAPGFYIVGTKKLVIR